MPQHRNVILRQKFFPAPQTVKPDPHLNQMLRLPDVTRVALPPQQRHMPQRSQTTEYAGEEQETCDL